MTTSNDGRPCIGVIIGDPCGIGPEVVVKSWLSGEAHAFAMPVLIGKVEAVERALRAVSADVSVRRIAVPEEATGSREVIEVIDDFPLDLAEAVYGQASIAAGRVSGLWLEQTQRFIEQGRMQALVLGPIDTTSMAQAGVIHHLSPMVPGETYLFIASGPLLIAHLTDHIPLRKVCDLITADLIDTAIGQLSDALMKWGIKRPRIGVAGLNPHGHGEEDEREIAPGVERSRARGYLADGPVSPDSVFRQCIEGKYDAVLAMFHDQGHIAVKTWGFAGNCVVVLGKSYPYLSVGHGVAYDIAGRDIADHSMIQAAMVTAGYLASGKGFPGKGHNA